MTTTTFDQEQILRIVAARSPVWRVDPVAWGRDVLGVDAWGSETSRWKGRGTTQAQWMRAAVRSRRLAVRSGHKTGKSRGAAQLALWFWTMFDHATVVLTAPTGRQIEEVCWKEVCELYKLARARGFDLGGRLYERPDKGLRGPQSRRLFGIAAEKADSFSGISAPLIVYIVDEGSGVDEAIWEAILGNSAGTSWVITIGNPTQVTGQFYRCFHEERHEWRTFNLSSEDTPNVVEGAEVIPGLATRSYIEERRRVWRPHEVHPAYAVRVRGDFPGRGANSVVSLLRVEAAQRAWRATERVPDERLHVGLDVARFGDDESALVMRRGRRVLSVTKQAGLDTVDLAGWAAREVLKARTPREREGIDERPLVLVDEIGVGAGVLDNLIRRPEIEAQGVNVAEASDEEDEFPNLRSQVWFAVDDWLEGSELAPSETLARDLLTPRYSFDVRGRRKVESKDEIKKRLGRSTDEGDALCLAIYTPPPPTLPTRARIR